MKCSLLSKRLSNPCDIESNRGCDAKKRADQHIQHERTSTNKSNCSIESWISNPGQEPESDELKHIRSENEDRTQEIRKKMSVIDQHRRLGIETNPPTTNESRTRQNLSTLAASMGYTKKIERKDRIGEEKDREDPTSMVTTTKNERKKRRGGDGEDVPTWLLFFFPLAFRARGWAAR